LKRNIKEAYQTRQFDSPKWVRWTTTLPSRRPWEGLAFETSHSYPKEQAHTPSQSKRTPWNGGLGFSSTP